MKGSEKILSIKIPQDIHQQLKMLSAQTGMSIKDIVLTSLEKQYGINSKENK